MGMLLGVAHSSCGCEGAVDIEEADGVLDRALSERRDDAGGGSGSGSGSIQHSAFSIGDAIGKNSAFVTESVNYSNNL